MRVVFSKNHVGPQLSETIIAYGDPSAARQAVHGIARAGRDCDRYAHSTSTVGANVYSVRPNPDAHSGHPGHYGPDSIVLRLDAVGERFHGLRWDVWVTSSGNRLAAVAFRSDPGGGNDDWHTAIPAAQYALERGGEQAGAGSAPISTSDHSHP